MLSKTIPQIFVFESDSSYSAFLRRSELKCRINSALSLEDLLDACSSSFGPIGIVEFSDEWNEKRLADLLTVIHRSKRKSPKLMLFAVGSQKIAGITKELLVSGFAQVFSSKASCDRMGKAASRYWNSLEWPEQNPEELVFANLPWAPIE